VAECGAARVAGPTPWVVDRCSAVVIDDIRTMADGKRAGYDVSWDE